jgi:chemotaxis signal transduction protein
MPDITINRFCYHIGVHSILLEANVIAEILTGQTIYPVPFAPEWCAGLTSVRGDLFPVMDMHRVILAQPAPAQPRLLLIKHPQFSPVILTCDGYPQLIKLQAADLTEHTDENLPSWIPHTLQYAGQNLLAADHGRLLRYIQRTAGNQT